MTRVPAELRRLVFERAGGCCEYCLLNQNDIVFKFHIEHIVSVKHFGETKEDNLCLSCPFCNRYKGTDIASADPRTGKATFLFNPRQQRWNEHFRLDVAFIRPLTPEGRVTERLLRLNQQKRIDQRKLFIELESYPCMT